MLVKKASKVCKEGRKWLLVCARNQSEGVGAAVMLATCNVGDSCGAYAACYSASFLFEISHLVAKRKYRLQEWRESRRIAKTNKIKVDNTRKAGAT